MRSAPAAVLASIPFFAACSSLESSAIVDFQSRYVSRGAIQVDDPVAQPSIATSGELGAGSFSASVWANVALRSDDEIERDAGDVTELDGYFDWTTALGDASITTGVGHYRYPADSYSPSTELFAALSYDGLCVTPTLAVWWDVDEADDPYVSLAVERTFDLAENVALTLDANLGWMRAGQGAYYFGVEEDGFSDLTLGALVGWSLAEGVEASARLAYARVLDSAFRDAVDESDPVWGGIGISFAF